jgi:DNA repair exonuclease SbcCD nuclease subunit
MKIALITDTHWGVRNDSLIQLNAMKKFLDEVFFPTLKERKIDTIIHLGDLVDRRKYINFVTANRLKKDFLEPIFWSNYKLHIIAGNHDTFYKNTNEINALRELIVGKYDNVRVYTEQPESARFDGTEILFVPWISEQNKDSCYDALATSKAPIVMGHFELSGFEMYRGQVNDHGENPKILDRFDLACSGHYHTKSHNSNIHYLGTPCQYTWSDYGDQKGFHILDTETRELEFIPNPSTIYKKVFYDDLNKQLDEVLLVDQSEYTGCYVKVVVKNKTNPYWFDLVIDKLEKANVADLQVVEDHFHLDLEEDDDIVNEAEDTITIIRKYISGMNINTDRKRVESIIQQLYIEAHDII